MTQKSVGTSTKFLESVRMILPSIGCINGGIILGKIGDVSRFTNSSNFLAFAGHNPSVYHSGNFQTKHTRISKRGSKTFLYALINVAHNVTKNNQTFKDYYNHKLSEGCSHHTTLGFCAGKNLAISIMSTCLTTIYFQIFSTFLLGILHELFND